LQRLLMIKNMHYLLIIYCFCFTTFPIINGAGDQPLQLPRNSGAPLMFGLQYQADGASDVPSSSSSSSSWSSSSGSAPVGVMAASATVDLASVAATSHSRAGKRKRTAGNKSGPRKRNKPVDDTNSLDTINISPAEEAERFLKRDAPELADQLQEDDFISLGARMKEDEAFFSKKYGNDIFSGEMVAAKGGEHKELVALLVERLYAIQWKNLHRGVQIDALQLLNNRANKLIEQYKKTIDDQQTNEDDITALEGENNRLLEAQRKLQKANKKLRKEKKELLLASSSSSSSSAAPPSAAHMLVAQAAREGAGNAASGSSSSSASSAAAAAAACSSAQGPRVTS
jgi:hypothetical protein